MNQHRVKANDNGQAESIAEQGIGSDGPDLLSTLHQSIGNAAVGRLVRDGAAPRGAVQRIAASSAPPKDDDVLDQVKAAKSGGQELPQDTRTGVEHHLGVDLSNVRVHTDSAADALSKQLNARAFTTGNDVFFRSGAYNPESSSGMSTLAHELTHVAQQSGVGTGPSRKISHPSDPAEHEADAMASRVTSSPFKSPAPSAGASANDAAWGAPPAGAVQKAPEDEEEDEEVQRLPEEDEEEPVQMLAEPAVQRKAEAPIALVQRAPEDEDAPASTNETDPTSEADQTAATASDASGAGTPPGDAAGGDPPNDDDQTVQLLADSGITIQREGELIGPPAPPKGELIGPPAPPKGVLAPPANEPAGAYKKEVEFDGQILTNDSSKLDKVCEEVATARGLDGLYKFAGAWTGKAGGTGNPDYEPNSPETRYWMLLVSKLDQAVERLDEKARAIEKDFELYGLNVIQGMLSESEKKLHAERERYGIKDVGDKNKPFVSDAPTGQPMPLPGPTSYESGNNAETQGMIKAAAELAPPRSELDKLYEERAKLETLDTEGHKSDSSGGPSSNNPDNKEGLTPPPRITDQAKHDKLTEDIGTKEIAFEALKKDRVAKYPMLAAFTDRGGGSDMTTLSQQTAGGADVVLGPLITEQLSNIDTVKKAISDGELTVWDVDSAARGAQAEQGWAPGSLNHRLTSDMLAKHKKDKAIKKIAMAAFQIAITIAAAALTGGASLGVQIARAGVQGGLAYMSGKAAIHSIKEYEIAKAMNGTDPEKAKVIAAGDPSLFWLALDIVAAVADAYAARTAFMALKGTVQEAIISGKAVSAADDAAKAGNAVYDVKKLEEATKPYPGLYEKTVKKIEEAQGDPKKVMAAIDEAAAAKGELARKKGPPPPSSASAKGPVSADFEKQISGAGQAVDDMKGQIPDLVRDWLKKGKVRPFTEEQLLADFKDVKGYKSATSNYARDLISDKYLEHGGFFDASNEVVYLKPGSVGLAGDIDLAGGLIHEAQHRLKYLATRERLMKSGLSEADAGAAAEEALLTLESELQAHFAERDYFYLRFFDENSPQFGKLDKFGSERAKMLLGFENDDKLVAYVSDYYTSSQPSNLKASYEIPSNLNIQEHVDGIFADIAVQHERLNPPKPGSTTPATPPPSVATRSSPPSTGPMSQAPNSAPMSQAPQSLPPPSSEPATLVRNPLKPGPVPEPPRPVGSTSSATRGLASGPGSLPTTISESRVAPTAALSEVPPGLRGAWFVNDLAA